MKNSKILLDISPEPIEIKSSLRIAEESGKSHEEWMDQMATWFKNKLSSYLWRAWRDKLASHGYSWQRFLRVLKLHIQDMILWALYNKISWNELVSRIIDSGNRRSKRS